jgi:hypothetical protein
MDDNLTVITNDRTIAFINREIQRKTNSTPYMSNGKAVTNVLTDMDHQPYTRWFRGVYYYPEPIVMEREAGWRTVNNLCYNVIAPLGPQDPDNHCYEVPCGTIYPCFATLGKGGEKEGIKGAVNKECIVKYR